MCLCVFLVVCLCSLSHVFCVLVKCTIKCLNWVRVLESDIYRSAAGSSPKSGSLSVLISPRFGPTTDAALQNSALQNNDIWVNFNLETRQ